MTNYLKEFWIFIKKDTWQSWLVSLVLTFVFIKFIFFPVLSFAMAAPLPLVVVESCSMYHDANFENWWDQNGPWYESNKINKSEFQRYSFLNGINKGDIVIVSGRGQINRGDVIVFQSSFQYPLIHRIVKKDPIGTKGDNNGGQLEEERKIAESAVLGKALFRIPYLGWAKLIFFEPFRTENTKGFCR